jgi:hypothetical protein
MTFARTSIALLAIQLALVSSIAAKYLYQRSTCPKAWTRAVAYDPSMVMRGRYISAQLRVDACSVSQPVKDSARSNRALPIEFDQNGNLKRQSSSRYLSSVLGTKNGRLAVERYVDEEYELNQQQVKIRRDSSDCADAVLQQPVDFYISEKAQSPFPLSKGSELWVEVTVPPKGPPRPIAMAIKEESGQWQPLNYR